jgi:hypothetical protein
MPSRDEIGPDTPLRLSVAATLAFPDGSMTASGLRRESVRGRLMLERIAGKDYTTLANIARMRDLCRVESNHPDCTSGPHGETERVGSEHRRSGLFLTEGNTSPQDALRAKIARRKNPLGVYVNSVNWSKELG